MKEADQETIEKMELDKLTREQQDTMYISYETDHDLKLDEEYVLIVAKESNNTYHIVANGYGIFKEDKESKSNNSESILKNVLTNTELTDESGKILTVKNE